MVAEVDMVADMEVDMVADMEVDKLADMADKKEEEKWPTCASFIS